MLVATRFLLGLASAIIVNATSLYLGEVVPQEHSSKLGMSVNLGIVTGIFFTYCFGLMLPEADEI